MGLKTGSGTSLIYECAPIVFYKQSTVIVIAPLVSIMAEQVERLTSLGFRATSLGKSVNREAVASGYYQFVFCSPEMIFGDTHWRDVIKLPEFRERHVLTVVDEAHTVVQWWVHTCIIV